MSYKIFEEYKQEYTDEMKDSYLSILHSVGENPELKLCNF